MWKMKKKLHTELFGRYGSNDLKVYKAYKNSPRSRFELWSDKWNHTGAMVRTIAALISTLINAIVLLRVFGKI